MSTNRINPDNILWRGPGGAVTRAPVQVLDRPDGQRWRGARVTAVTETEATVEVRLEHSLRASRTFARALAPSNVIAGDPIAVRVTDPSYAVAEVIESRFLRGDEDNPLRIAIVPESVGGVAY